MFKFLQALQQISSNEQQIDFTNESQTIDVPLIIDGIFQSPNETNLLKMNADEESYNSFNKFEPNSEPENTNSVIDLDLRDPKNWLDNINSKIRTDIVKLGLDFRDSENWLDNGLPLFTRSNNCNIFIIIFNCFL